MHLGPGYGIYLIMWLALVAIRWPHEAQSRTTPVADDRMDLTEKALLFLVGIGWIFLPILAATESYIKFADDSRPAWVYGLGALFAIPGLWLFYRSHTDLGRNWSPTLQIRQEHRLVQKGVYRSIRHPMYAAIFMCSVAQMLLIPNWIAGSAGFAAFALMFLSRLKLEEQMMVDQFGDQYLKYRSETKRLIPQIW